MLATLVSWTQAFDASIFFNSPSSRHICWHNVPIRAAPPSRAVACFGDYACQRKSLHFARILRFPLPKSRHFPLRSSPSHFALNALFTSSQGSQPATAVPRLRTPAQNISAATTIFGTACCPLAIILSRTKLLARISRRDLHCFSLADVFLMTRYHALGLGGVRPQESCLPSNATMSFLCFNRRRAHHCCVVLWV